MQIYLTDVENLINFLRLSEENQKKILKRPKFPLLIPYELAKKIKKNDLNDPILRQYVPLIEEEKFKENYLKDPLQEEKFSNEKFIKKYKNRALLLCTSNCFVHCRYCFRKFLKKVDNKTFENELKLLEEDKTINEIILSGGDPLTLPNKRLSDLFEKFEGMEHIKTIRFHTKALTTFPSRFDTQFFEILKKSKKQIIFVFHINHQSEIDDHAIELIEKLKSFNFLLFNQAVLLKNVNDNSQILEDLFKKLVKIGIVPYYLHNLDKVEGSSHFEVSKERGKRIMKELLENLPGYMVPRYVEEIPFEKSKTPIM
ncbi:MAG: hypothetical protein A3F40_02825 [Chlamydiae bacterium RIFCSPHIGHO2_12_FULL_27_8]|nr:MAG: hypothetical protein A3F40_02825 [Chlamydiae bacterium RIFCSPHIGHO2_12_FULL_27_8]